MLQTNNKTNSSHELYDGKTLTSQETEVEGDQVRPLDIKAFQQMMDLVVGRQQVGSSVSEEKPLYFNASTYGSNRSSLVLAAQQVGPPDGF
jgi:fructose-1,6-bisphosphatase